MRFTELRWFAGISLALALLAVVPPCGHAQKRAKYGGMLRVELRAASVSLDPRQWKPGSVAAATNEKLAALVYDRLITLDDYGRFQPALAIEWSHDSSWKTWQFKLHPGVKFSDGSAMTSADVAAALQALQPAGWQIAANESAITIRVNHPDPHLLEQLASGRFFIFRAQTDGTLLGTGPFYTAENIPATPSEANPSALKPARMKFRANDSSWAGRPFVDTLDVTLGEPALRQLLDLQVGKADVVEIAPDLARKARQDNLRVWNSAPQTLLALRFDPAQPAAADARLREALDLALDRDTMANVLLQREAAPAAALLPQWLSGYAFLFGSPMNLQRAKEIRATLPVNEAGGTEPLRLRVDASGDLTKLLGERVVVNARQASLGLQVVPRAVAGSTTASPASAAGLHLFAWHYESLSPRAELEALVSELQFQENADVPSGGNEQEKLYAQERRLVEDRTVLPLVVLPEYVGIGANVRNWNAAKWGDWRLADVWLEPSESAIAAPGNVAPRVPSTNPASGARP